jgi:hypothetical protein
MQATIVAKGGLTAENSKLLNRILNTSFGKENWNLVAGDNKTVFSIKFVADKLKLPIALSIIHHYYGEENCTHNTDVVMEPVTIVTEMSCKIQVEDLTNHHRVFLTKTENAILSALLRNPDVPVLISDLAKFIEYKEYHRSKPAVRVRVTTASLKKRLRKNGEDILANSIYYRNGMQGIRKAPA